MSSQGRLGVRPKILLYGVGVWLLLAVVGIVNGLVRALVLQPVVGEYPAHVAATLLTGIPAFIAVMYLYFRYAPIDHTQTELTALGALWLVLTVAFKFGFGHYVVGHPWSRLLADYNLLAGRLWVLVLLTILIGPRLVGGYLADRGL